MTDLLKEKLAHELREGDGRGDECMACNRIIPIDDSPGFCIAHFGDVHSDCIHPEFPGLCIHCANIAQHAETLSFLLEKLEEKEREIRRLKNEINQ